MEKLIEILNMALKEIEENIKAEDTTNILGIRVSAALYGKDPSAEVYLSKKESLEKWAELAGTSPKIETIDLSGEEYIEHSVQIGKIKIYAFEKIEQTEIEQTEIEQTEPEDETAE